MAFSLSDKTSICGEWRELDNRSSLFFYSHAANVGNWTCDSRTGNSSQDGKKEKRQHHHNFRKWGNYGVVLLFAGDETMLLREERGKREQSSTVWWIVHSMWRMSFGRRCLIFDRVVPTSKMNASVSELDWLVFFSFHRLRCSSHQNRWLVSVHAYIQQSVQHELCRRNDSFFNQSEDNTEPELKSHWTPFKLFFQFSGIFFCTFVCWSAGILSS